MRIEINGAPIFFDVVGSKLRVEGPRMAERPSMLVLHGGPGFDHATMRPYFDRFADTHQVIYLDHHGNGRSGGDDPSGWNLAQWGDDIHDFCTALEIEKPVVYGLSFGGMVAMSYGARHPEAPSKLVFSSTAGRMDLPATYAMMLRLGGPEAARVAEEFWSAPSPKRVDAYLEVCMPLYNPIPVDAEANSRSIMRTEVMFHFIQHEQRSMDLLPGLAAVRCPTLVLAGGLDPITPVACSEAIFAALPEGVGELVVFPECGHGIHRAQPERAEAVLRRFLT